jgi:hypothetical protein
MFENSVLRKIFGLKRDEMTGSWRKPPKEELHNLFSLSSIIRMIKSRRLRWAGHVRQMGMERNAYRIVMQKPEGRRPLGRPRHRWVDSIKLDLTKIGWGNMDWIDLAHDRGQWRPFVNTVMNLPVP